MNTSLWLRGIEWISWNFNKDMIKEAILQVGRNSRAPKKANHGARPCSSVMRRERKK